MGKTITRRTTILGLVFWLNLLAASFLLFGRTGQLILSQPLFKPLIVLLFGALGAELWAGAMADSGRHKAASC
jgi:hypothetical protein